MTSSQNPYQVTTTDSLKVCDTRYYCIKHGEHKLQWTTTKPSENERAVGCLVDVLHAHATAYGCVNSIKGSKPACTQTRPCLSNGVDDMIHCLEPTTDAHLPDLLAADQKCVLSDYDHKTDSVERYMRLGTDGGDIAIMRKNDPLLVDAAPHAAPHAVSPAAAAAVAAAAVAAAVAAAAPGGPPPPAHCAWSKSGRPPTRGCVVNDDCDATPGERFRTWWDVVSKEKSTKGSLYDPVEFMLRDRYPNVVSSFGDKDTLKGLNKKPLARKAMLRQTLLDFYMTSDVFQAEVQTVINTEKGYVPIHGKCTNGGCVNSKVRLSSTIFDGTEDLGLEVTDSGTVLYKSKQGTMRTLRSERCEGDRASSLCTSDDVTVLDEPRLRRGQPVHPTYRVTFPNDDSTYVVFNHPFVSAERGGADGQQRKRECAEQLCELNEESCPAPHCTRAEGGACRSNPDSHSLVRIIDV